MAFLMIVDYCLQIDCIILTEQLIPHTHACLSNIKHHGGRRFWGASQRKGATIFQEEEGKVPCQQQGSK